MQKLLRCGALLLWAIGSAQAEESLHIIELKHRPAAELIPAVQPLLKANEALSATDYRLIVRATDARIREIEPLIRKLDVARRQLTVSVRHTTVAENERRTHSLQGEAEIGKRGRVILPGRGDREGAAGIERNGIRYTTESRTGAGREEQTQMLRVQDGGTAFIRAGQSIPHIQRVLTLSGKRAVLIEGVALQDVTTGFEVRPRVRGENVQLDITPRLARAADPAHGLVNFQELSTSVNVRLGEWIDLGQILGARSEINRAILDSSDVRAQENRTILLKVE